MALTLELVQPAGSPVQVHVTVPAFPAYVAAKVIGEPSGSLDGVSVKVVTVIPCTASEIAFFVAFPPASVTLTMIVELPAGPVGVQASEDEFALEHPVGNPVYEYV